VGRIGLNCVMLLLAPPVFSSNPFIGWGILFKLPFDRWQVRCRNLSVSKQKREVGTVVHLPYTALLSARVVPKVTRSPELKVASVNASSLCRKRHPKA